MEDREALVLDSLCAVLLDVLLQELELSLISVDWVAKIILVDLLSWVADERANRLDARAGLQVLGLDCEVEQGCDVLILAGANLLQNAHKHLLEAFKVPVLVNAGVDDA